MESTIVWRQIHKLNQKLRLHNLIGLGLTLGFGYLQYPYLRNCYLGPQKIDAAQLLKIKDPSEVDREFITFTADKAMDTGFKKVSKSRSSETETNQYVIALIGGEKVLLVEDEIGHNLEQATFTGTLSTIDSSVQTKIVEPLLQEAPLLKSKLLPFILETGSYESGAYFLVPLLLCGSAIFGWNLYKAKIRNQEPRKHPLYQALAKYGDADTIASNIDREIQTEYNIERLANNTVYVTPSWLLYTQTYGVQLTNLDQLMWVYKKVTSHSVNFIPTGKSYEIAICDKSGKEQKIKLAESLVDKTIEDILNHAPWAIAGFNDEIKALWDKSREEFYEIVEGRKQQYRNN